MFGMIESLAKAAVATVATPVALAVDIVKIPVTAGELNKGPFDNTSAMLKAVGDNVSDAVKPNSK